VLYHSLLKTKLFAPPARQERVSRPHLLKRLDDGLGRGHFLITAPAGFGKTSLLSEWLESPARPPSSRVAWLSLDEGDNELTRFLTYLVAALGNFFVEANPLVELHGLLGLPQHPPIESLLTTLINDLHTLTGGPYLLILDDYHVIHEQAIHQAVGFLLDHLPPPLRIIFTSRADPPLPLARLRARGRLAELRANDLRFTVAETSLFLNQIMGLRLAAADIAALEARTEGWVAGLQLAALSMQNHPDNAAFIAAFTGSHHYIVDYLVEEVLQHQPAAVQYFLLHTSILNRLCGPLCDTLLADEKSLLLPSQPLLEQLERANLFLVPLDEERRWYRYHHLFADLLRSRLRQSHPHLLAALHRRASEWYEQNGWLSEAIDHALAAADFSRAANLVTGAGESLLNRGEYTLLRSWLEKLPAAVVGSNARLLLFQAAIFVISHQLDAAERCLQEAAHLPAAQDTAIAAEITAGHVGIAVNRSDYPQAMAMAQQALAQLPLANLRLRSEVLMHLGLAYSWSDDLAAATEVFTQSWRFSETAGNIHITLLAIHNLAGIHFMQGQLDQAAVTYRQALQLAAERGAAHQPITGVIHAELGDLLFEWYHLAEASYHLQEAIKLGERGAAPRTRLLGLVMMARLLQAQSDSAGALAYIEQAEQIVQKHNLPQRYVFPVVNGRAQLWLAQGNRAAAAAWVRASGLQASDLPLVGHRAQYRMLARVLVAQGDYQPALQLLLRLHEAVESLGRENSIIENLAVLAVAYYASGDTAQARASLLRALALAEPQSYVRTFVEQGPLMATLLRRLKDEGKGSKDEDRLLAAYLNNLLAAFGDQPPAPSSPPHPPATFLLPPLPDPLTDRELEVLRLLAAGLSNQEIAARLVIVLGTVKRHVINIYSKLDVHSRTQALQRARELGLL
jgi:LuxR family transcriptional regulator, maltose regulon positive regulatory protein